MGAIGGLIGCIGGSIVDTISYALCGTTQPISEGLGELIRRLIGK